MSDFNDLVTKLKEEATACDSFYTYTARLLREAADVIENLKETISDLKEEVREYEKESSPHPRREGVTNNE